MQNQKETAHSCKNAPLDTQKNSTKDTDSSNRVNTPAECQIKTPLERLPDWEAEAERIANAYTRTLAPHHLRALRLHYGGIGAQLRAYRLHLANVLHSLKGGAA
jgi:hypothetical protein